MKIDFVLTACNLSDHYLNLYPSVVKVWKKKFNLDCYLILIATSIPDFLKEHEKNIILFEPIEGINDIFIAQVIRILYPCLFNNKNILITDVDIFPISYNYFIKSIENIDNNIFITYRDAYLKQKMIGMCYNLANSETWKEIFGITNIDNIICAIKQWYNTNYTGEKNCPGWYVDQQKLYEYVMQWKQKDATRLIILTDHNMNFKRLDKRRREYILQNIDLVKNDLRKGIYTDFHTIKPYSNYKKIIEEFVNIICTLEQ